MDNLQPIVKETIELNGAQHQILPNGETCECTGGAWCCVECREIFTSNIRADAHESRTGHNLKWLCWVHGVQEAANV